MLNKSDIRKEAIRVIDLKLKELQDELQELQDGLGSNAKSSAGDKHETGRAMLHLEQERMGKQIEPLRRMRSTLEQLDTASLDSKARMGSLINTDSGTYYLSVGLGQLEYHDETIFCLSPITPLGKLLVGTISGQEIEHIGKVIRILQVA